MWWRAKQTVDLGEQRRRLKEARQDILRQIEILETPAYHVVGGTPDSRALIETLQAQLAELNELLGDPAKDQG